jgi:hypothetical protein
MNRQNASACCLNLPCVTWFSVDTVPFLSMAWSRYLFASWEGNCSRALFTYALWFSGATTIGMIEVRRVDECAGMTLNRRLHELDQMSVLSSARQVHENVSLTFRRLSQGPTTTIFPIVYIMRQCCRLERDRPFCSLLFT